MDREDLNRLAPLSLGVMGVAASRKSTIGALLASALGSAFVEGEDLHPAAHIDTMSLGRPLTDEDRRPWLESVAAALSLYCSALKADDRRQLVGGCDAFLFLRRPSDALCRRLARRTPFKPAALAESRFEALAPPEEELWVIVSPPGAGPQARYAESLADLAGRSCGRERHAG